LGQINSKKKVAIVSLLNPLRFKNYPKEKNKVLRSLLLSFLE